MTNTQCLSIIKIKLLGASAEQSEILWQIRFIQQ